ncbi:MAG: hypothetical protein ACREAC_24855, partial [Blastocatellia bacterium]
YKDHSSAYFDELYLVGKPQPDALPSWSNGGKGQINPLNSAEVVAALSALNFFAGTRFRERDSYIILSSNEMIDANGMRLYDLPFYEIGGTPIDPEKVLLATLILRHLLLHQIPWRLPVGRWQGIEGLRRVYLSEGGRKQQDLSAYKEVSDYLSKFVMSLIDSAQTQGWDSEVGARVGALLSDDPKAIEDITRKLSKSLFGSDAKEAIELGQSSIRVSTFEFGKWFPEKPDVTRGEYLRFIWTHLFNKSGQ